jgi:hypothetical protein
MRFIIISSLCILFTGFIRCEEITAKIIKETVIYSDYQQHEKIAVIQKDEYVQIENQVPAHKEDPNYWGFDLQLYDGSIRVKYKDIKGYVDFNNLESIDKVLVSTFHRFSNKVLVPVSYCDALYKLNSQSIEKEDPFILNYDKFIKYLFITDINKEWYYNYPINRSSANDIFFQITSRPIRYNFSGFVMKCTSNSITVLMDCVYDQFNVYENTSTKEEGRKYTFNYIIDEDYITISDNGQIILRGVFIEDNTWDYIYYFFRNRLMKSKKEQSIYDKILNQVILNDIKWPVHKNNKCDYPRRNVE